MKIWNVHDPKLPRDRVVALAANDLKSLLYDSEHLAALEVAGVDNWQGAGEVDRNWLQQREERNQGRIAAALAKFPAPPPVKEDAGTVIISGDRGYGLTTRLCDWVLDGKPVDLTGPWWSRVILTPSQRSVSDILRGRLDERIERDPSFDANAVSSRLRYIVHREAPVGAPCEIEFAIDDFPAWITLVGGYSRLMKSPAIVAVHEPDSRGGL